MGSICFIFENIPGIDPLTVQSILQNESLKGVILETYGSGNGFTADWFVNEIKNANERGLIMYNVSQCLGGRVTQGKYQTLKMFEEHGVISGKDITSEAAVTKMMYLLSKEMDPEKMKSSLAKSLRGEMI